MKLYFAPGACSRMAQRGGGLCWASPPELPARLVAGMAATRGLCHGSLKSLTASY